MIFCLLCPRHGVPKHADCLSTGTLALTPLQEPRSCTYHSTGRLGGEPSQLRKGPAGHGSGYPAEVGLDSSVRVAGMERTGQHTAHMPDRA